MTWRDKLELGLKDDAAFRKDNLPPAEVHGTEEDAGPGRSPVIAEVRDDRRRAHAEAVVDRTTDDDAIADAQGSDMESEGQGQHPDTPVTKEQSAVGVAVDAQMPDTMPRGEDDVATRAGSREFHDHPGSGNDIARRLLFFAPAR